MTNLKPQAIIELQNKISKDDPEQLRPLRVQFVTLASLLQFIRTFLVETEHQKNHQLKYQPNEQTQRKHDHFLQACKQLNHLTKNQFSVNAILEEDKQILLEQTISIAGQLSHFAQKSSNQKIKGSFLKAIVILIQFSVKFLSLKELKPANLKTITKYLMQSFLHVKFFQQDKILQRRKGQQKKNGFTFITLSLCNKKICAGFYFLFQIVQTHMLEYSSLTLKSQCQKLYKMILNVVNFILVQNQVINFDIKHQFIKNVVLNVGSYELPVLYLFNQAITQVFHKQFSKKYSNGQGQLYLQQFNKQVYCLKNLQLYTQLIGNFDKQKLIQCRLLIFNKEDNFQIQESTILVHKQNLCFCCGANINSDNRLSLTYVEHKTKNQIRQVKIQLFVCDDCLNQNGFDKQSPIIFENSQYKECKLPKRLLLALALSGYSRQEFDIEHFKNLRKYHTNLLTSTDTQNGSSFQVHQKIAINSICIQPQLSFRCLKWLYYQGLNQQSNKKGKKFEQVVNYSIKSQIKKVITLSLILINNSHQKIRGLTLDFLQKIAENTIHYFDPKQAQSLISCLIQGRFNSLQTYTQNSLKLKYVQLLQSVVLRLDDFQQSVRLKSFNYFNTVQSTLNSKIVQIKLTQKLFRFIQTSPTKITVQIIKLCDSIVFSKYELQFSQDQIKKILDQAIIMMFNVFPFLNQSCYDSCKLQISIFAKKCMKQLQNFTTFNKNQQNNQDEHFYERSALTNYLHKVKFTSESIKCFSINQKSLEHILQNLPIEEYYDNIFTNIKLIFQQICEQIFVVNQKLSKSRKSIKSKAKKKTPKSKTSEAFLQLNLNRLISIMLKYQGLPPSKCQILKILLQKNYLLNYQKQYFTQSPCKIKKLVLNIQSRKKLMDLIGNVQVSLQDCSNNELQSLIQLHVISCLTVSTQKRIQLMFYKYKNVAQYFKNQFLSSVKKDQEVDPSFLIRTMKILTLQTVQKQRYNKIDELTNSRYSYFQKQQDKNKKYKIFSGFTQEIIKKLQCQPQTLFIQIYEMNVQLLQLSNDNNPKNYKEIVQYAFYSFQKFYNIHPELILHSHQVIKRTLMRTDSRDFIIYRNLFLFIKNLANVQNPYILQIVQKIYKHIGQSLLKKLIVLSFYQTQSERTQLLTNIMETLNQLIIVENIGAHQANEQIIYSLFCKQKQVNQKAVEILQHLNQKQLDGMVLAQVCQNIQKFYEQLYFIQSQKRIKSQGILAFFPFERVNLLNKINKHQTKPNRVLLQKDIRTINLRTTFVKKVGERLANVSSIATLSQQKQDFYLFLLKLLSKIQEMDIFQYKELIYSVHKVINQSYAQIVGISSFLQDETVSYAQYPKNRSLQSLIVLQQFLYYFVLLTRGKKVQILKKQLQKNIGLGKFTQKSIQIKTIISQEEQTLFKQNPQKYFYIENQENICQLYEKLENLSQQKLKQQIKNQLIKLLSVQIQELHLITLGCKFTHKKRKQLKNQNLGQNQKKKKRFRMILQSDNEEQESLQPFEFDEDSELYFTSVESTSQSTLKIKQLGFKGDENDSKKTLVNKTIKSNNQFDKKQTKKAPKSVSAPKIKSNLSSILQQQRIQAQQGQLIRSKRLSNKARLN